MFSSSGLSSRYSFRASRLASPWLVLLPLVLGAVGPLPLAQAAQTLASWGRNDEGQLGDGTRNTSGVPLDVTNKGVLNGKTIVSISAGFDHTLAICSDGTVAAWGGNFNNELGDGTSTRRLAPIDIRSKGVLSGKTVVQVLANYYHSFALCSDGTVAAWGTNYNGQLGDGTFTDRSLPFDITGKGALAGKTVIQLASYQSTSYALCSDGTVAAWGVNGRGQIGDGSTTDRNLPVDITDKGALNGKTVTEIVAGPEHALALCSDNSVMAWGSNAYGQLGAALGLPDQSLPVDITGHGDLNGKTVVQLGVGMQHSLALCSDGSVMTWGDNIYGQLGDGTTFRQALPKEITGQGDLAGKTVSQIGGGLYYSAALCSDGTLLTWGTNEYGELGNGGSPTQNLVPSAINNSGALNGTQITQIAPDFYDVLALATVKSAPLVTTGAATGVTTSGATLSATVNPTGLVTTAKIEYGLDTNYGSEASLTLSPNNGGLDQNVSAPVSGLMGHTTYHYRVSASNSLGTSVGEDKTFFTNNAPTDLTLSRNSVQEKLPSGAFVGALASADPDAALGESFTYTLVGGDTNAFAIDGAYLRTNEMLDEATKNSYDLTIRTTDSGGLFYEKNFTIHVIEATKPTVILSSPSINQKVPITGLVGDVISGTATDNKGVAGVKVRLSRKRGTANQYWNGTDFVAGQAWLSASVTVVGEQSVTWTLAGQLPSEGKLDAGLYNVQVYAFDAAGNKSDYANGTFTLTTDTTAPTLSINSPTLNQKLLLEAFSGYDVSGRAADDGTVSQVLVRLSRKRGTQNSYWNGTDFVTTTSWVSVAVNEGGWSLGADAPDTEKLDSGAYQVEAYAIDGAGNKSTTARVSFSLGSDYLAPSVSIATPTSNQVVDINALGAGSLSGAAGDNLSVVRVALKLQRKRGTTTYYWNGSDFTSTVATFDATYSNGTWSYDSAIPADKLDRGGYTLYATAYDGAGHKTTSASRIFAITGTISATGAVVITDKSAGSS